MKYYLIAGEASGDLHGSQLMQALKNTDSEADFRFFGGDLMSAQGGTCVKHYKEMAYMGFVPVLLHLRTISRNMALCKQDIVAWQPDVVIMIDYPGFNLSVAAYLHRHTDLPVYYYIAPKIWAWKEYRIKNIRRDIEELFSILPFEVDFFEKKHHYPIHYVGNPTVDEVTAFKRKHAESFENFTESLGLSREKPIIALLAGSRKQEIQDNLPLMIEAVEIYIDDYQIILAGAPGIDPDFYTPFLTGHNVRLVFGQTYRILQQAKVALVTSGTATLETALFRVPQIVCYYMAFGKVVSWLRRILLHVKYISLVNLIADSDIVPELVADEMTVARIRKELESLFPGGSRRKMQLDGYERMSDLLGKEGASLRAAHMIQQCLSQRKK